jgi:hypothetical protein
MQRRAPRRLKLNRQIVFFKKNPSLRSRLSYLLRRSMLMTKLKGDSSFLRLYMKEVNPQDEIKGSISSSKAKVSLMLSHVIGSL